jgi:peroxiredoxin Q/BCP
MLEVGDPAPEFTLPNQDGDEVSLSDHHGRPVFVYFYPKDGTPGCTRQACGVRDRWSDLREAGAVVLGISPDTIDAHASFAAEHELPFDILSDVHRDVLERYGAWGEKVVRGEKKMGVIRSTFLVGPSGRIEEVWRDVDPGNHADQLVAALDPA